MGCHLIALGGTGQKTLEMLTYACACDAVCQLNDDLRRVPLDTLSALTIETGGEPPPRMPRRAIRRCRRCFRRRRCRASASTQGSIPTASPWWTKTAPPWAISPAAATGC